MEHINFELKGAFIELIQLLKAVSIAQTGGHAKIIVEEGCVNRNGEVETRKRAKIKAGDKIEVELDSTSIFSIQIN